jgi:hypothetical protein
VLFSEVEDPRGGDIRRINRMFRTTDIVVSTAARLERYRDVVNTVYWPAAREGKVLYARAA